MKFMCKLKKAKTRAMYSYVIRFLTIVYFFMITVKGIYFWTERGSFLFGSSVHSGIKLYTSVFPINYLWEVIPAIPLMSESIGTFSLCKPIILPIVICIICTLYISDYRALQSKYYELQKEIEKEINLRDMRKDAGLETLSESASIDIVISNATNDDPAWHNTAWGKVIIGVAIVAVLATIGLK